MVFSTDKFTLELRKQLNQIADDFVNDMIHDAVIVANRLKEDDDDAPDDDDVAKKAAKSAKKLGQEKSEILHSLMMSKEEATVSKEISQKQATSKSRDLYEQVRFAPIHGPTPMAPELEPPKSSAGLILGLAGSVADSDWKALPWNK